MTKSEATVLIRSFDNSAANMSNDGRDDQDRLSLIEVVMGMIVIVVLVLHSVA